ncbi:hypothetical protein JTE90_022790 [Oedothorax gibbosus]|uniref:Uncharacterized protein n=1 Tax=Oedothorax gibbosus TaxID=931172 RepID=A0AAV6U9W5_9ARAC|nr:hypothetical protein JTE90_022790 [Oedothorax gibbosus]
MDVKVLEAIMNLLLFLAVVLMVACCCELCKCTKHAVSAYFQPQYVLPRYVVTVDEQTGVPVFVDREWLNKQSRNNATVSEQPSGISNPVSVPGQSMYGAVHQQNFPESPPPAYSALDIPAYSKVEETVAPKTSKLDNAPRNYATVSQQPSRISNPVSVTGQLMSGAVHQHSIPRSPPSAYSKVEETAPNTKNYPTVSQYPSRISNAKSVTGQSMYYAVHQHSFPKTPPPAYSVVEVIGVPKTT